MYRLGLAVFADFSPCGSDSDLKICFAMDRRFGCPSGVMCGLHSIEDTEDMLGRDARVEGGVGVGMGRAN
jgi:hypothetical protein